MRTEPIEVFSDATNAAIMRHPGRRFPGVLVQGDTLYSMCRRADEACRGADRSSEAYEELNDLRNHLWELLTHYKSVLREHDLPLPFPEA
jgi:hypothetical protein